MRAKEKTIRCICSKYIWECPRAKDAHSTEDLHCETCTINTASHKKEKQAKMNDEIKCIYNDHFKCLYPGNSACPAGCPSHLTNLGCPSYLTHPLNRFSIKQPNEESSTAKADKGKARLTLVPRKILFDIARIREYGTEKYGDPDNWKQVEPWRYRDAMMRHMCAYLDDPESVDEESGLPHLWHLACNVAFLCEMEERKESKEHDGRDN